MARLLIFADVQAQGHDSDYKEFRYQSHLSCVYRSLIWISELVKEHKPDAVVCLGDVSHIHSMIDVPTNNAVFSGFKAIASVGPTLHVLSGNHDLDTREQKSSYVDALGQIDNVAVHLKPEIISLGGSAFLVLPYLDNPSLFEKQFDSFKVDGFVHPDFGLFHCTFDGVSVAPGVIDTGLSKSFVSRFKQIYSGHYHEPGNFSWAPGSIVQLSGSLLYNDYNDDCFEDRSRGAILVDTTAPILTKASVNRIPNPYTPFYLTVSYREKLETYEGDPSRTFLRVAYEEPEDLSRFLKVHYLANKSKAAEIQRSNIKLDTSPEDAVREYGKMGKMSAETIEYAINILGSLGFVPRKTSLSDFRLIDCKAQNFLGNTSLNIQYDSLGLAYVEGSNKDETCSKSSGSGKSSSLVEPIIWSLWDATIRGLKGDEVINDTQNKDCYVLIHYMVGTDHYEVVRSRNLSKTKITLFKGQEIEFSGSNVWLFKNGTSLTKYKQKDTNSSIEETHGISWTAFISLLIMGSTLQGEYGSFTRLGPYDRVSFVESFVSWLEIYPRAFEYVSARMKALKESVASSERDIQTSADSLLQYGKDLLEIDKRYASFEEERQASLQKVIAEIEEMTNSLVSTRAVQSDRRDKLKVIEEKRAGLPDKRFLIADIDGFKAELSSIRNDIKNRRAEISNLVTPVCSRCKQVISVEYRDRVTKESEDQINELTRKEKEFLSKVYEKEQELSDRNKTEDQIRDLINEITSEINAVEYSTRTAERDILRLKNEIEKHTNAVNPHKDFKTSMQERIELGKKLLEEKKSKLVETQKEFENASIWTKGFSPTGVRSFVIDSLLNGLNNCIFKYCEKVFRGAISVTFVPEITMGRMSIGLNIKIGNKVRSYTACCGGERRRVDLVSSLSLRELLLSLCNASWNIAIFDEATDALDEEASELVVNTIREISPNALVISHNPFIKSLLDRCIKVEKSGGIVRVAIC